MEPDYQGQPITTPDAPSYVPGVTDQMSPSNVEEVEQVQNKEGKLNYNQLLKDAENNISDVVNFDTSIEQEPQLSQIESEKLVAQNNWVKESLGNIENAVLDYENFLPESTKPVKNRALIRATMEVELGYDPPTISEY